jgi:hypothetical protein
MQALIIDALKDFDSFKDLSETIPAEVLAAECASLTKRQQQKFQEYCLRLNQEKQRIEVNHVAHYTNPDKIPGFHKFENLDLTVVLLIPEAHLAICRLPDGTQETFGVWSLRRKD